jgi:aspartate 4-decarboxylase
VSFANLPDEAYTNIGRAVRAVVTGYVREYEAVKRAKG